MYLTMEQDYAIRIVYQLYKSNEKVDVKKLSEKTGVTPSFTQKIMRKLNIAGLVTSTKGIYGGYTVSKSAENISIFDVIIAIENNTAINSCLNGKYVCNNPNTIDNNGVCCIQCEIEKINKQVDDSLKALTYDKILHQ